MFSSPTFCFAFLATISQLFIEIVECQNSVYVDMLAGTGTAGFRDGLRTTALFNYPSSLDVDSQDNVYVADCSNNRIRKITQEGLVSTFAGSGAAGSADGFGTYATINCPRGVAVDKDDNLIVGEGAGNRIRKITPGRIVTLYAGTGTASSVDGFRTSATFNEPRGIFVDGSAANIFVADYTGNKIRKLTISSGVVSTLPGTYYNPSTAIVHPSGDIYVTDTYNHRICKISEALVFSAYTPTSTGAFVDGPVSSARFNYPIGLTLDVNNDLLVAESGGKRVRRINVQTNEVSTYFGGTGTLHDGPGTMVTFSVWALAFSRTGKNIMYLADYLHRIKKTYYCVSPAVMDIATKGCICPAGTETQANGTCSSCAAGYFKDSAGSQSCSQCPLGYESSADRQSCVVCGAAQYRTLSMSSCQSCDIGSEVNSTLSGCAVCFYGRIRSNAMSSCTDCPLGQEASSDRSTCNSCASGYYRSSSDYFKCIPCPPFATCSASAITACSAGYKINSAGTGCEQCPVGTQSSGDFLSCVGCTVGTNYRSSLSQSTCQSCPAYSACLTASSFTCNTGYEATADGTGCQACAEGYSKSGSGNTACTQCGVGTESATNKQSCSACVSGKYRPNTSINKCVPCPQNGACTASALTCNAGYKLNSNGDGCDQCPLGQQSNAGFTACVSCTSGTNYRSSLTQNTCQVCPSNSACIATGFTCDAGYEPTGDGAGCQQCLEGYSKSASGNSACTQCAIGTESAANKQSCVSCASGFYHPSTGYNKCIPCPPNGICTASTLTRCANGYIVNSNGDGCNQCPIGQDSVDGLNCQGCGVGYFKPLQSYPTCIACPQGAPSCGGSSVSCQTGYFFDSSAQCKRNETYFAAQQTGTVDSGTTITEYMTITQTSTSTSTTTSTTVTSLYFTATMTQTQPMTVEQNSVTVTNAPVTIAGQSFFVTVTSTISNTQSVFLASETVVATATVFNANGDSSTAGESNIGIAKIGDVSPLVFGVLMFMTGGIMMMIASLLYNWRRANRNKNVDFEPIGITTTMNTISTQRTFTDATMR